MNVHFLGSTRRYRWALLLPVLLLADMAFAATYTFRSNNATPSGGGASICSGSWSRSGSVFTCSGTLTLGAGDILRVRTSASESLTDITVVTSNSISLSGNTIGTTAKNISLQTSFGDISATGSTNIEGSVSTASGAINLAGTSVSGSVTGSGTATLSGGSVGGNVSIAGNITTNGTAITGNVASSYGVISLTAGSVGGAVSSGGSINTNGTLVSGSLTSNSGTVNLSGGSVGGVVRSGCCNVTTNGTNLLAGARSDSSGLSITGGTIAGDFIAANNPATFSGVTMTSGSVSGASTVTFTNSTVGDAQNSVSVTSVSGPVTLNNSTVYGDLTAPSYSTIFVNSPSTVIGTCVPNSTPANACSPANGVVTEILNWSLDQSVWTGAANEVVDASVNGLNGTVFNGADTADSAPALPTQNSLGTCAYGSFNSMASQYVERVHNSLLTLQDRFTIGLWVKPNTLPASGLMSILSKDENYEFHLKPNGTVNWWWQTTGPNATREFDSTVALTPGQWSHVLIRFAPGDQRIYINGNLAGQASFSGTPLANSDPLQLGADQNFAGRYFNGQLDELRIYSGVLSEAAINDLVAERHQCGLALQCFNDDFGRTSLGSDWAVASRGATAFTPAIASARMRLTSNQGNVATSSTLQRLFPAAGNYIQVQFKHYAYNGSGADGIAVVLSDASVTPQPGAFGGPLGYGSRGDAANPGFAGGWLGVGIDEYGNFSTEGGPGGPGQRPDSVAIRGSGSEATGYRYIAGTPAGLNPGIDDAASSAAAPGHTYRITMDGRIDGQALVTVERDSGAGFVVLANLDAVNVLTAFGQDVLPTNFFLSLTGSTGGSTNIHELDDLQVCATTINPITEQIDHFDFAYANPALTCSPQEVIVRACLDAGCNTLYTDPVTMTLAPAVGWTASAPASVSGGNVLSFSGGSAVLQLRNSIVGQVAVGALASTPTAKPNSQTTCSTTNCLIDFLDSGFIFDVPTLLANQESAAIGLFAVRKDDTSEACVPAFESGTRTLQFWSEYNDPNSGSRTVQVNGTSIAGNAPGSDIDLDFSAGAQATIRVHYADAGLMTLSARYAPSSGEEAGLVMSGADQFVSRPVGLCVYSDSPNSDCASGDAGCSAFVAAGDGFRLRMRGATWEEDGDADFCDNGTTPNYRQSGIALASTLVAPAGGASGALGTETVDIVATGAGEAILTSQSLSEVGVFTISATPVAGGYFGETVGSGTSVNLGRFYPASFDLTDPSLTPACGISTYAGLIAQPGPPAQAQKAGQTFAFNGSLSALNRNGAVTRNYTGAFAKLSGADIAYSDPGGMGVVGVSGTSLNVPGSDGAGHVDYSANAPSFLFNAPSGPYNLAILTIATDSDGVTGSVTDHVINEATGNPDSSLLPDFRLGQARIGNAHGSELQDLAVPFTAAYFTGRGYAPNPLDSCSNFAAVTLGTYQHSDSGSSVPTLASGPYLALTGLGNYQLSAPGAGGSGSLPLTYAAPAWLKFDWNGDGVLDDPSGLATFGIYRGAAPLIFRRELYR